MLKFTDLRTILLFRLKPLRIGSGKKQTPLIELQKHRYILALKRQKSMQLTTIHKKMTA